MGSGKDIIRVLTSSKLKLPDVGFAHRLAWLKQFHDCTHKAVPQNLQKRALFNDGGQLTDYVIDMLKKPEQSN